MPKAPGAPGASSGAGLDVASGNLMLALLAFGCPIWAGALASLEIAGIDVGSGAAGYTPDPRRYAVDLFEVFLSEDDTTLEAGGLAR